MTMTKGCIMLATDTPCTGPASWWLCARVRCRDTLWKAIVFTLKGCTFSSPHGTGQARH
jgi:hypothetical protein